MIEKVPAPVMGVLNQLAAAGRPAYLVGGCVRDHLLGRTPKDYDITTAARPEEVIGLFPKVIPTGIRYGTVTVMADGMPVEVTTYRADGNYSDGRRPDSVTFGASLEEDLSRRDFTINAMAWAPATGLVDPFDGAHDLKFGLIRAVGDAEERFREDALRMMRAVRFANVLHFRISPNTEDAMRSNHHRIRHVAMERIREELNKILLSERPSLGIRALHQTTILSWFLLELCRCHGFDQLNSHHRHDVFDHILNVVDAVPPVIHLRLAALLHDIAKPHTFTAENGVGHFYGHEDVGAQMAFDILVRLKYDRATIDKVVHIVQHHMFPSGMGTKAIRRFIARVGAEAVPDLLILRVADISGSGVPEDTSHVDRIRTVLEEMQAAGISHPKQDLAVNGTDVMAVLGWAPGPKVGAVLRSLTERVLDDPSTNTRETLLALIPQVVERS